MRKPLRTVLSLLPVVTLLMSACGSEPTPAPTQDVAAIQTQAAQTVIAELTANAPAPTQPPAATALPTATEPPPGASPDFNIPVAVVPTPAPGEPAAVANYNTIIFSGPGEDYLVYASFFGSMAAKVIGVSEDDLWWAISVPPAPNGQGWVSADWVTVSDAEAVPVLPTPPLPPTVELVPPGPDDPQATALVNVAVRTGPGANFPAYGIGEAGQSARLIGVSEDHAWWVVRLNPAKIGAGYGWVLAEYTQARNAVNLPVIETPETISPVPPPPPPAGAPSATALDYLNVRRGPGLNYPVLFVAPPGASGEVNGRTVDATWWQVVISDTYAADGAGWVSAGYVATQNTVDVPVVETPPAPPPIGTTPPELTPSGCPVVAQDPADNTSFAPGSSFKTTWVLQNRSDVTWDKSEHDLRFIGAANNVSLHQGYDVYDLESIVEPGWTYNFTIPMIAPYDSGTYGELWQVTFGNQPVCQFYVYIEVE